MEIFHTPLDKPTPGDVWAALETLPQRVRAWVKKCDSSSAGGFEDFEREPHTLFAQPERVVTGKALARHDVDLPFVFTDGEVQLG